MGIVSSMLVPLSIQKSSAHEEQCIAKPLIENEVGQLCARLHLQSSMLDLARCDSLRGAMNVLHVMCLIQHLIDLN